MSPGHYTELFFLDEAVALGQATDPVLNVDGSGSTPSETLGFGPEIRVEGSLLSRMKSIENCIARELIPKTGRSLPKRP